MIKYLGEILLFILNVMGIGIKILNISTYKVSNNINLLKKNWLK
jgi:hypothetical protein